MVARALGLLVLANVSFACGARTQLNAPDACATPIADARVWDVDRPLSIAFLGATGAYDETDLQQFLVQYPATVTRIQFDTSPVSRAMLDRFDIVILDRLLRDYSPEEAQAFAAWLHDGGSAMSLSGFANADSDWSRPNSLLADLGSHYLNTLIVTGPSVGAITRFAMHPVTTGLTSVPFYGGYNVALGSVRCDETMAVAFDGNTRVALVQEHGRGRLLMWGDEWVEFTSQWRAAPDTRRFWANAIGWLAHRT